MADKTLCRAWADLCTDPDNPDVAAAARARLTDFVFHVPFCDACRIAGKTTPAISKKVFDVLGNIDHLGLSEEELEEMRAIDALFDVDDDLDDDVMETAVEALFVGLPDRVIAEVAGLDLVTIFRAIQAIDRLGEPAGHEDAIHAIYMNAGVSRAEAELLWHWQLRVAADYLPTLYQWSSSATDFTRWREPGPLSREALPDVLAELKDAVAAGTRLLFGIKSGSLSLPPRARPRWRRFTAALAEQNRKIAAMLAALDENRMSVYAGEGSTNPQPGSMVSMVRHLRTFERKKQRCLGAIAKAPVSALGRGENAMKARKLAAESETAAAGNIIELEELAKL